ncbi:hypothetical protein FAVG1_06807 [Fusarium avenaceum]|nr:hypothetical protein FAVG1_06807 [Fusarium avenaceum]
MMLTFKAQSKMQMMTSGRIRELFDALQISKSRRDCARAGEQYSSTSGNGPVASSSFTKDLAFTKIATTPAKVALINAIDSVFAVRAQRFCGIKMTCANIWIIWNINRALVICEITTAA